MSGSGSVTVSVLLPTYNRAAFLPEALACITGQTLTDWELVVVDDGSSDDTEAIIGRLTSGLRQPVRYIRQANAGAYGARNTALGAAAGRYVAFYDSDDLWLPHHLQHSVDALEAAPEVDWVYAACRVVDLQSGQVLDPDTFILDGRPRPFRALRADVRGAMRVFTDARTIECAMLDGLYCGLQNSVIRRSVFATTRFQSSYRNEAEDQLFVIRSLKRGHRMGYIDAVHVQYHVHDANSSAAARGQSVERDLAVYRPLVRGFEELQQDAAWTPAEKRALARRLCREYFWHIGYAVLWRGGRTTEAMASFRLGLRKWPWSLRCWKTYAVARLRLAVGVHPEAMPSRGGADS